MKMRWPVLNSCVFGTVMIITICLGATCWGKPFALTDDAGHNRTFERSPERVVCCVPSAAEIIVEIGAQDALVGITHHSLRLKGVHEKALVGGFASPSAERILALSPDLVIVSSFQQDVIQQMDGKIPVWVMDTRKMDDSFRHMLMMGKMFGRTRAAEDLVTANKEQLDLIARKVSAISDEKRKRVMRIMGLDPVATAGNDSFQNEMIRAAGGIAPDFGTTGAVVPVSQKDWEIFNPQVVYGCGETFKKGAALFDKDGWNSVDAVQSDRILSFPCDLTCRCSAHVGLFVSWLAARIYADEFSITDHDVNPSSMVKTRDITLPYDYVKKAVVAYSMIHDFENKSLVIDFNSPQTVVSTLDGQRSGILTVGNHYSPPPSWALKHSMTLDTLHKDVYDVIGKSKENTTFLFTGADMDNLTVVTKTYKAMSVTALVTAGVCGNAVRMGTDTGNYYEPGTINILILTSMKLTPRAMTRAIISATEGKTAALEDLDIRSTVFALDAAATGTGTDNMIVVQGEGPVIENAGGHCKMGELIARAVHEGVTGAIEKQNGIVTGRSVFDRLEDRHITIRECISKTPSIQTDKRTSVTAAVEQLLIDPYYAGFFESALALCDGKRRKTVTDIQAFDAWCIAVAERISGKKLDQLTCEIDDDQLPRPVAQAINALITGVCENEKTR